MSAELDCLLGLLPERGRFLDIGAFDGRTDSLTRELWVRGWSGVLVEPNPVNFSALLDLYGGDPEVTLVNAPLMPVAGPVEFWSQVPAGQLSSASRRHVRAFGDRGTPFRRYCASAVTPRQVLDLAGGDVQFLSIDAEGVSLDLLAAFPLSDMPGLVAVCIEHDGQPDRVLEICAPAGLAEAWRSDLNIIVARGGGMATRLAHAQEIAGSTPAPATTPAEVPGG